MDFSFPLIGWRLGKGNSTSLFPLWLVVLAKAVMHIALWRLTNSHPLGIAPHAGSMHAEGECSISSIRLAGDYMHLQYLKWLLYHIRIPCANTFTLWSFVGVFFLKNTIFTSIFFLFNASNIFVNVNSTVHIFCLIFVRVTALFHFISQLPAVCKNDRCNKSQ